jgi:flagellar hook-associated protein 3 FlgL
MRVTNRMISDRALASLSRQGEAVSHAQEQVTTGKRIVKPSDDPAGARRAVRLRDSLAQTKQYLRNIDTASAQMKAADAAFDVASDAVLRAKELAVQASNGSLTASDRAAITKEVEQLARTLVGQAATKSGTDYVFSGFRTDRAPFAEAPAGSATVSAYAGDSGSIKARIGPGVSVGINVTADVAFKPALDALAVLHADLLAGKAPSTATSSALDTGFTALSNARTDLGARENRIEQAQTGLGDLEIAATSLLSNLEDTDFAEAITELNSRQTAYEAAVKSTSKILTTSLLDYLR